MATYEVTVSGTSFAVSIAGVGQQGLSFSWKGAWVTATDFAANDVVENDGSSYICILAHTSDASNEPGVGIDTETYWALMVEKGADGVGAGTVTSVDVTGGTGLDSSGGPVTSSGAITVSLDAATIASLALADSAIQSGDLATVATTGAYTDLSGLPTLGTAAATDATDYATAAQGVLADSAIQPADLATVATTGAYTDLSGLPTLGTAAATDATDYATAAQGALADTALQPGDLTTSVRTLWVDPAGDDANDGDLPTSPVATISAAVALAEPGDIIRVRSGTYTEIYPLILPRDVSVFGDGLRNVEIRPTAETNTNAMWLVDSGAYLWGMTFARHQAGSFAVAFNENADNTGIGASDLGAFVLKSPYIQNCSSYTAAEDAGTGGSTSVGATGGGMEIDGAKCASNSPIRSMVVDSYTQVNLNGPGCLVKNDAYAQLVSFFGTFCSYHVKAETGGQVNLSNSTTNFGTFGLVADGRSATAVFTGTAAAAITGVNTITVDSMSASRIGPSSRPVAGMVFDVAGNTYTVTGAIPNGTGWDVNFFPVLDGALSGGETVEFFQRSQISTGGHVMEYVGAGTNYNALPWYGGVPIPANEIVQIGDGRVFFSSTDQLGNFRVGSQFDVNGTTGAVTINTDDFNLSGLNAIGPFSRDGIEAVGVQLQEVSNNVDLLASTGVADGNTAPTQFAVKSYLEANYTLSGDLATVATTGAYTDLSGLPTLGTAAATDAADYATAAQGVLADSALQAVSGTLDEIVVTGGDTISLATAVTTSLGLADSAIQPADLATVATTGAYTDLSGLPTLGTAAATDATDYATAAQGALADSAIQPADLATVATTGAYTDLSGLPTLVTALNGLSDVTLTSAGQQDRLRHNGTLFVNEPPVLRSAIGNASGATTVDLNDGELFTATATGAVTWTFSNVRGNGGGFVLTLTNGGDFAQTWPASVDWPEATAPTLTSGGVDVLVFITDDGGTTWRGALAIGAAA